MLVVNTFIWSGEQPISSVCIRSLCFKDALKLKQKPFTITNLST